MKDSITLYDVNKMNLQKLIDSLDGLLHVLEFNDLEWKEDYIDSWKDLEIAYASALDKEASGFDPEDTIIISNAINKIKKLVQLKLNESAMRNENDY